MHKVTPLTVWDGGRRGSKGPSANPLGRASGGPQGGARTPGPAPARDRLAEAGRVPGLRDGAQGMRPRGLRTGGPPPSPPGPAAAGPLGLGSGEAGVPGEGPGLPTALTSQPAAPLFSFFSSP